MKTTFRLVLLFLTLIPYGYGRMNQIRIENQPSMPPLDYRLAHFELTDSTIIEGLSKLSLEPIAGLHLGIEVALRETFLEGPDRSIRFSLSLENARVRDIVEALCQFDGRYAWSTDGPSINVYPRETIGKSVYLLNRELEEITLESITDPDEALTPLAKLLPGEQIGYAGVGGGTSYSNPWSAVFKHLTVRQLMNRVTEHIGPRGWWIWSGSKDQRFFFWSQYGFKQ
jgi:hypothetical protein